MKKNKKQFGDLIVENDYELGFSIYDLKGNKICFFNKIGEVELVDWIINKDGTKKKIVKSVKI